MMKETSEEVEISIKLAANVKKSDINVIIRGKSLQISAKTNATALSLYDMHKLNDMDKKILSGEANELQYSIDTDCSTWTLENMSNYSLLQISLCKNDEKVNWSVAFK